MDRSSTGISRSPQMSRSDEYEQIFALDRQLGGRSECAAIARYVHSGWRHRRRIMPQAHNNDAFDFGELRQNNDRCSPLLPSHQRLFRPD